MVLLLKTVSLKPSIRDIEVRNVTFCIRGKSRSNKFSKSL